MSAVLLVPLLPLIAALIVGVGREITRHARAKIAAWPIGAAFCGAIATLYVVATEARLRFDCMIRSLPLCWPSPSASTLIG